MALFKLGKTLLSLRRGLGLTDFSMFEVLSASSCINRAASVCMP